MRLTGNKTRALFASTFLCLGIFSPLFAATPTTEAYIGVYVNSTMNNSFYPVLMSSDEIPYLKITDTLKQFLELPFTIDNDLITVTIPENQLYYSLDLKNGTIKDTSGALSTLPKEALIQAQGEYWLRYDAWEMWLPLTATWNKSNYELYLAPQFTLLSQTKLQRHQELERQKLEKTAQEALEKSPVQTPQAPIHAQGRYSVNWLRPLMSEQSANAQYAANVDVLTGTFATTGSTSIADGKSSSAPAYWSYTLQDKPGFHLLQVGDFFNRNTLLVPALNLKDGFNFAKAEQKSQANGFEYRGQTQPNTEIDIWHNGILLGILTSDAGGSFTFNDPNSKPGDEYLLRFYFQDGTEANKIIRLSSNSSNLLEPKGEWNTVFQTGELDNQNSGLNTPLATGRLYHAAAWYGLSNTITTGVEFYEFPGSVVPRQAAGIDIAWQTLPTWSNVVETLGYKHSVDHDWQSTYTGLEHHVLQFEQQVLNADSPLQGLALPLPYTLNLSLPTILPSATRFWSAKDIYSYSRYQFTSEYKRTNVGDVASETVSSGITSHLSLALTTGLVRPLFDSTETFTDVHTYYYLTMSQLLQLSRTFAHESSQSTASYRYQGLQTSGWDFGADVLKPDHDNYSFNATVEYRLFKNFLVSLSGNRHEIYLTLSLQGIIADEEGPLDYEDYATGSISGYVMAPPEQEDAAPTPIAHAKIVAGGETTETDENGHYFLSGLPTQEPLEYKVDPNSLDAALIPHQAAQRVLLRPGTYLNIDPVVDWSAGIDGNVYSDEPLPDTLKVVARETLTGNPVQEATVEPNGFFILDKLRQGTYYLSLEGINHPPKPIAVTIDPNTHWASGVKLTVSSS